MAKSKEPACKFIFNFFKDQTTELAQHRGAAVHNRHTATPGGQTLHTARQGQLKQLRKRRRKCGCSYLSLIETGRRRKHQTDKGR